MRLRRLYPDPAELSPERATEGCGWATRPPDRPYVGLNMVATLDGRIAIDGRSGAIGGDADRELFHGLRTQVDAVMVGAGTLRAERYGRIVPDPARRRRREAAGLAADPLAIVVSGVLDLPPDLPLLQDEHSAVTVLTAAEAELPPTAAAVTYLRGRAGEPLELAPLLSRLRSESGVRSILCEGGPGLNHSLLWEGLVDELFLSIAPKLAGGDRPLTLLSGAALPEPVELELVSLLEHGASLFGRYRVLQGPLHA